MIAVVAGLLLVLAWAFGPFSRIGRRQRRIAPATAPATAAAE
jgi:hypothetical protein